MRLRLQSTKIRVIHDKRPKAYLDLRYWWLHELRQLRAKRRNGVIVKKDIKIAQKELVRIRKEYIQ